jgi:hypothetical protein
VNDEPLAKHRISIEIGRIKNPNKNPVAEKAIEELELELLKIDPLGGTVSPKTLAVATASLNTRIRSRGLSAREILTQRDQFSNKQIEFSDQQLILKQHESREINHPHSEKSKAPSGKTHRGQNIGIGDLVGAQLRNLNATKFLTRLMKPRTSISSNPRKIRMTKINCALLYRSYLYISFVCAVHFTST